MSVRKRKWTTRTNEQREVWVCDYTSQTGSRHLRTFARKKDADSFHATVRVDVASGVHTPASKSPTVSEAAESWLAYLRGERRERSTIAAYEGLLRLHILPRVGRVKLSALSTPFIQRFRDELLASGMSRASGRKTLGTLKSLLRDAQRRGNVAQNVAIGVSIRMDSRDKRKLQIGVDVPTPQEIARLINSAHGRSRVVIATFAFCGLRASELRGLRWCDVELDESPRLHVRQRVDRYRKVGALKSRSAARSVPIGQFLVNALRAFRALEQRDENGFVFCTQSNTADFHQSLTQRVWHRVQIAAGVTKLDANGKIVPKYSGLHALRHFFASWCINSRASGGLGLPAKVVQERLGHASIVMTMDRYSHLFANADEEYAGLAEAEKMLDLGSLHVVS